MADAHPLGTEVPVHSGAPVGGGRDGQAQAARDGGAPDPAAGAGLDALSDRTATDDPATEFDADDAGTGAAEAAKGKMTLEEVEMHAVRAIRYHEARARFLDLWRRMLDFLVVLGGAGAVTAAANESKAAATALGIALAAIGALQLVAGLSEKAGEHTALKRRFAEVLARAIEARGDPDPIRAAKIVRRWTAIFVDEPPTLHVLEAIAYNAARRSFEHDLDESTLIEIGWWQSLTRNLSSWEGFEPLTRAERAARRAGRTGE